MPETVFLVSKPKPNRQFLDCGGPESEQSGVPAKAVSSQEAFSLTIRNDQALMPLLFCDQSVSFAI